jgi:hypothetical protein
MSGIVAHNMSGFKWHREDANETDKYSWYKRDGVKRSYGWVKQSLQQAGLVKKAPVGGKHRKRR